MAIDTGCVKEESIKDLVISVRNGAAEINDGLKDFLRGTQGKAETKSPTEIKPGLDLIADGLRDTRASLNELREVIGVLINKITG